MSLPRRLLIVGYPGETHVGRHLADAATALGLVADIVDAGTAFSGPAWKRRVAWRLGGRRPVGLRSFSASVEANVREQQPDVLVTTGLAPVDANALDAIGRLGVRRVNFLTDDPWNPAHRATWFLEALARYDHVWTPRRATLDDLRQAGVPRVNYLPFAYSPAVHWREEVEKEEAPRWSADVLLAGGADPDRVAWVEPLIRAGLDVALYGGYWHRYAATRGRGRGMLDATGLRRATVTARVSLGLVRRANRDEHAMRTFEVPAMGGCLLAERTRDHEQLFGADGACVLYAAGPEEAVERVRWLLGHASERDRMAHTAHALVTGGRHTYMDRLMTMLEAV